MRKTRIPRIAAAVFALVALLGQGTWVLAGTTGTLTGVVYESGTQTPIAGATVVATSPSQTATATTDAGGRFSFVSLAPDAYDVAVSKDGYDRTVHSGVVVFADQTQTLTLTAPKHLKEIGNVTSRASSELVKSGTTSDVYSVNSAQQTRVQALGGGGGLNNAYSAIASVPGVYVPLNQNGYYQTVHVRGGDYDQLGYELDGVPVNRSFDNYPAGTASSLGQQELQIYTGASPANSEGQGLAGYINQVIRTGTYPGFATADLGIGTPSFYHKAAAEVGGATPSRLFSYYVGVGGYQQDNQLYVDHNNGTQFATEYGNALGFNSGFGYNLAAPGTQAFMAPPYAFLESGIADRDVVVNMHIGIPHKRDAGKDDIQLLWDSQQLHTLFYDSPNDLGAAGAAWLTQGFGQPNAPYTDSEVYAGQLGVPLPAGYQSSISPYYFPNSPTSRQINAPGFINSCTGCALIPGNARDTIWNNQEIEKIQYQKNFSSNAYLRVYGYAYYSNWLQNGPVTALTNYFGPSGPDYELFTHTRGVSASFADQLNPENLFGAQISYSTANSIRSNNLTFYHTGGAVITGSANPQAGLCYDSTTYAQISCYASLAQNPLIAGAGNTLPAIAAAPGACGGSNCEYYTAESGFNGKFNQVVPNFYSYSLTDQWRPNDKWLINLGLRLDEFGFNTANTNGPARPFWFNVWNAENCITTATGAPFENGPAGTPCPAGSVAPGTGQYPLLTNASAQKFNYNVLQPRIAGTFTQNPDTVWRFSYGKYAQPPTTAYEQYNEQQQDLASFLGNTFYVFGFNTPGHGVAPSISFNYDISLEKHLKGTDWSFKLTPFMRKTQNQIENFFLDQRTGFVSGLNLGRLTAEGVEFQINKGDFSRNGLAGQLAFTYTNAYVNYNTLPNGTTILTQINQNILNYNAYTSYCAANPNNAQYCAGGKTVSGTAAPCYTTAGAPDLGCAATSVANPYWNANPQALLSSNANYVPYDIFPGGIGSTADSYNVPYVATLILNYKHDKLNITPSFQFQGGNRYGAPETWPGITPDTCTATLPGSVDAGAYPVGRYPYGAPGGAPYDATSCGSTNANGLGMTIPDPFTNSFDAPGSFVQPNQFLMNLQLSYDVSPRVTVFATMTNLVNACWGGTTNGFTSAVNRPTGTCSYGIIGSFAGLVPPVGNIYNPNSAGFGTTAGLPRALLYPYEPTFGPVNVDGNSTVQPFNVFFGAHVKI